MAAVASATAARTVGLQAVATGVAELAAWAAAAGSVASAEQVVATAAKPGRLDMTEREAAGPEHKQLVAPAERAVGTPALGRLGRQGTAPQAVRFARLAGPH